MYTWKKVELSPLENDTIIYFESAYDENAHLEKGRKHHHWKMMEYAHLENARHGKCTT